MSARVAIIDSKYGFYSSQQAELWGTFIYRTAEGREVEVSTASETPSHDTDWPDIVKVGENLTFVRKGRQGALWPACKGT